MRKRIILMGYDWSTGASNHSEKDASSSSTIFFPLDNSVVMGHRHDAAEASSSLRFHSLVTVGIIGVTFLAITVTTSIVLTVVCCKRNAVHVFQKSEQEDVDDVEMEELEKEEDSSDDTTIGSSVSDDASQPLCRPIASRTDKLSRPITVRYDRPPLVDSSVADDVTQAVVSANRKADRQTLVPPETVSATPQLQHTIAIAERNNETRRSTPQSVRYAADCLTIIDEPGCILYIKSIQLHDSIVMTLPLR